MTYLDAFDDITPRYSLIGESNTITSNDGSIITFSELDNWDKVAGNSISYGYDAFGRIQTIQYKKDGITQITQTLTYDVEGNITDKTTS